jgi:hypothetical protein
MLQAIKLFELIDLYGDSLADSNFYIIWSMFLNDQPIDLPTQPDSKISKICR